ncbi:MAG: methyltransferase regulatory domain-containing protein [Burkholderiaceae bacterium]|nr:methyltransferase regulatory domain-containing protein [Burkholderiaceae bacterium]
MIDASNWSRGYPVHELYPPAWHGFQSPSHLRMICAMMGVAWDVDERTPLQIAEVGCGTGYTAQLLAAASPNWNVVGLDYNPAHIAEARSVAAAAGLANLQFIEVDVAELDGTALEQLPELDLVTAHGLWSWVADPVRDGLLRLIRRRLKPGGLAMVSYNALPGSAGSLGLASLVRRSLQAGASNEEGLAHAGQLVKRLVAAEPAHLPKSAWRQMLTGELPGARPGYLLHEFSTAHWRPSFHADVAMAMGTARCDYVGSATIDENFPQMSLSPEQLQLWEEAPDPLARELIFDLCVPRPFRRDLFVRGLRRVARDEAVDALWLALADQTPGERMLRTQLGEARLPQATTDAAVEALARRPQTVAALRALDACRKVTPSELVALLVGSGCAVPLWRLPGSSSDDMAAAAGAQAFNAVSAARMAHAGRALGQFGLAAPALGGALRATSLELAAAPLLVGQSLDSIGAEALAQQIVPRGEVLAPDVLEGLTAALREVLANRWPLWRRLGIV